MLAPLLIAASLLFLSYLYRQLRFKRFSKYASLPQLPNSLLLGHLGKLGEYMKRGPADVHPDTMFTNMHNDLSRPPLMMVDLWPLNRPTAVITSHELAEQITRPSKMFATSTPKNDMGYLEPLIGSSSILAAHGEKWKGLRRRFTAGFAPSHLMTLLPLMAEKTGAFIDALDTYAQTGQVFGLVSNITSLTFDIIGAVVIGVDLGAQSESDDNNELLRLFRALLATFSDDKTDYPWWLIPHIKIRRNRLGRQIDHILREIVRKKWADRQQAKSSSREKSLRDRSILSLSLDEYGDQIELSEKQINETGDQLKTFLLAGHDTTSTAISWVFYELTRTPQALQAVRAELDAIFGPDTAPDKVLAQLLSPPQPGTQHPIHRMTYISAVIKEAFRVHPSSGSAREPPDGSRYTVRAPDGTEHCLNGTIIYICHTIIQRDRSVFGSSADDFVPERWLDERAAEYPASAWRPFERGPRACIGQEFANIEIKVIIAMAARRYDFVKVGLGELVLDDQTGEPKLGEDGQYLVKSELYKTRQVIAKPVDGMRMKVKLAS
ncbi:cytochrome P450 [Echria macrotheca]|uniref:Cytochrome P450 n=1 Tax=Echria macrotheca TaxID=438768 RepID=A0AAJ0BF25_9PEZI|nr:cytochrome P450 [Echria macrotheca]